MFDEGLFALQLLIIGYLLPTAAAASAKMNAAWCLALRRSNEDFFKKAMIEASALAQEESLHCISGDSKGNLNRSCGAVGVCVIADAVAFDRHLNDLQFDDAIFFRVAHGQVEYRMDRSEIKRKSLAQTPPPLGAAFVNVPMPVPDKLKLCCR